MTDRMDELLAEALATGAIPDVATAEERAELQHLLASMRALSSQAADVRAEASASMPIAKARFERFLQQQSAGTATPASSGTGRRFGWFRAPHAPMRAFAAVAAVVALVAAGALLAPALLNDVDSASAQVLVPGEYVQFEAVAGETVGDTFAVDADFGNVEVVIDDDTELVDGAGAPANGVRPGRVVVVGGVVGDDHRVRARTVAVSDAELARPEQRRPKPLEEFREVGGRIVAFTLGNDGQPRVAILTENELVVVKVDAVSLEALLKNASTAVGANVTVVRNQGDNRPVFGIQRDANDAPSRPPPGSDRPRPHLPSISGVAISAADGILSIDTPGGRRDVALIPGTQFRVSDPTFDRANAGPGDLVGRVVTAFMLRPGDGSVPVAYLVVIGRREGE
jgi:hypothetical protein